MKHLFTLIIAIALCISAHAQSQRLVLLEEFTSSTCGPCAGVNPTFHTWQVQNPDKLTSIYYHVSWPSPGNDPMYLANKAENNARVSHYGVTYVPFSVLDGNYYKGSANGWNMTNVNTRYAMPSPFDIAVRHQVSAGNDSVYVTMVAKVTQDINAPMVAHNVVIEKHIHFNSPPGTNGEKDFYNVMKKMLPGASGTNLINNQVVGDYTIIEGAWKFGLVYNVAEIAAVSFIQNKNTKEIYQSANSTPDPLVMPYDNDVEVMAIDNIPTTTCLGKLAPRVKVRNNGNNPVTSFEVKYQVNGGALQSHTWNGNLATLAKTFITLPVYSFTPLASNTLKIFSVTPNSLADQYPKNDTLVTVVSGAKSTTNTLYLVLRTDSLPQQISWDVKNSLGQVLQTSPVYTQIVTNYRDTIDFPAPDCYTFTIYDTGGDGICCNHGSGGYEIKDSQGQVLVNYGGLFTFSEATEFKLEPAAGVGSNSTTGDISVFPNPFGNQTTVHFSLPANGNVTLALFNLLGKRVYQQNLGMLSAGDHTSMIEPGSLGNGIYLLQVTTGSTVKTMKVTISR